MFQFEEIKTFKNNFWAWAALIILSAFLIAWGMLTHMMVHEEPPKWDFGQLYDTPSESAYSNVKPNWEANSPNQIEPDILEQRTFKK
jgi:hypothetical protein